MARLQYHDISGVRFGLLTAKCIDHVSKHGHAYWLCECDCGNQKLIRASHLKAGNVRTCGCVPRRRTHGYTGTRLYVIWNNMKQRCSNPNSIEYHRYGGRGITVCSEWVDSFEAFRDWSLANGYGEDLSIDRFDNDGNYEPTNCRWATATEQANNTGRNRLLTYNGETHTVAEWSRILRINTSTINARINRYKWSVEDALGKESRKYGS